METSLLYVKERGPCRIMVFKKTRVLSIETLGIAVEEIPPTIDSQTCGVERTSVIIKKVVPGKPAHHAGLNCGDIIIRVGEDPVCSAGQFIDLVHKELKKGEIKLLIRDREQGRSITLVFLTVR
jgi:S1-C subfamily serine protease